MTNLSSRMLRTLIVSSLLLLWTAVPAAAQDHYEDLEYPPLEDITVPDAERVELDNGMVIYLLEDHELPLVELRARIGTGSVYEPAEKVGLADLTASVMRTGGTQSRSGDEINQVLERIAASVELSIGTTSGSASASAVKEHFGTTLDVFEEILRSPRFAEDKIEVAKTDMRSSIARRNDDAQQIAFREFRQLIYGDDSPYGREPQYATVDAIEREDLIAFHDRFFHPDNIILGIWGDFETEAMVDRIRQTFGDWQASDVELPEPPDITYDYTSSVNFIPKSDVNQSVIMMGHIGGQRDNPDYFALQVMNNILGGGFSSRLFRNVRTDQGLAYAVFGQYGANYDYPGVFYAGSMTRSEATVEAVRAVRHEVRSMLEEPVTEEELSQAKESFLNSFVFNFDSRGEIVNRLLTYEYYDYPRDFLQQTKEGVEQVTREDVQRVAREYLRPDAMELLIVGNRADIETPLTELGEVNEIDISIPQPEEEAAPEATETSLAEGRSLLDDAVDALGGKTAFAEISTVEQQQTLTLSTPQGDRQIDATMQVILPDRLRIDLQMPGRSMSQIIRGDEAYMVTPQGTQQADASLVQQLKSSLWREIAYLFARTDVEGLSVQYVGSEEIDGQPMEVVLVEPPEEATSFRLFLEADSKRPRMLQFQGTTTQGAPAETRQMLEDYRAVGDDLLLPHTIRVFQDGEQVQEQSIAEYSLNESIDEERFSVE